MKNLQDEVAKQISVRAADEWRIEVNGDFFHFTRYVDGALRESYRYVDRAEASVWAVAVINGFQPPRRLCDLDIPTD